MKKILWNYRQQDCLLIVHLVTRGHFRSRDKDGGHTIRFATAETPMLHAYFTALCFYRTGFIAGRSSTLREYGFSTYFAPVTLTLTQ